MSTNNVQNIGTLAVKTTLVYAFASTIWVVATDGMLAALAPKLPPSAVSQIAAFKGVAFVIVSAVLLYFLLKCLVNKLLTAEQAWLSSQRSYHIAGKERRKTLRHLETAQRIGQLGHWEFRPGKDEIFLSRGAARIIGFSEAAEQSVPVSALRERLVVMEGADPLATLSANNACEPFERELRVKRKADGIRDILVRGECHTEDNGECLWIGTCIDLTERNETKARVVERERQYRKLVEMLPDAVLVCREDRIIFANPAAVEIFGANSVDALHGLSVLKLIEEDTLKSCAPGFSTSRFHNGVHRISSLTLTTLQGKTFDGQLAARNVELEKEPCVQLLISDVSEREKTKQALVDANARLTDLASRTVSDLELERKAIAQALHDEIGQSLTAVKLASGWLKRKATEPEVLQKIDSLTHIATDAIEKVRDLSLMLRPPQLDELGLVAAVRWQATRLLDQAQISWKLELGQNLDCIRAPEDIVAFRVIQEALTNVIRHSRATQVTIRLRASRSSLSLEVGDNGVGFSTDGQCSSLGLSFMRERVHIAGGKISVESAPDEGTCVRVRLPVRAREEALA